MSEIFVVGVGRSGTSLLQSMLAAHPQIAMLPETGFFRRYVVANKTIPGAELETTYEEDDRLQRVPGSCWNTLARSLDRGGGTVSSMQVYKALLSRDIAGCVADATPDAIRYTGDKDPRLIEYASVLRSIFPQSWLVHIVRDPRDVLLSKTKAAWSKDRSWRANLLAGRIHLDMGDRIGRNAYGERYLVVRYEDLISDPVTVLTELTGRLGLPFDSAMLSFADAASRLGGGRTEEWKKETLGPLLTANRDKWKTGLTREQIRETEAACRRGFSLYGYRRSARISPIGLLIATIYDIGSFLYRSHRRLRDRRLIHCVSGGGSS